MSQKPQDPPTNGPERASQLGPPTRRVNGDSGNPPAMPSRRSAYYNASQHNSAHAAADPYLRPAFPLRNRLRRLSWNLVWMLLYRPSPRPLHAWRSTLLRLHGAKLGPNCHFYPTSKIWAPWNLTCADQVTAADDAEIYNPAPVTLGSHAILSQAAYLCGATHDFDDPAFPLLAFSMQIGAYAWVCARASVAPGVNLGDGAVLGLGSVATRDLEPWTVYVGSPAVKIKERSRSA
jgi:putative colanic acid biosynthesis acetyltransferase WcaF